MTFDIYYSSHQSAPRNLYVNGVVGVACTVGGQETVRYEFLYHQSAGSTNNLTWWRTASKLSWCTFRRGRRLKSWLWSWLLFGTQQLFRLHLSSVIQTLLSTVCLYRSLISRNRTNKSQHLHRPIIAKILSEIHIFSWNARGKKRRKSAA